VDEIFLWEKRGSLGICGVCIGVVIGDRDTREDWELE
jgi:hypothetical protein